MPDTTKFSPMATMPQTTSLTIGDIWRLFRGAEDTMRYYADIFGSVILQQGSGMRGPITIPNLDPAIFKRLLEDGDNGNCRPPKCKISPNSAIPYLRKAGEDIGAISEAGCALLAQLGEKEGTIDHYASTVPGRYWK